MFSIFNRLPTEIMLEIADMLPISDVLSLESATRLSVLETRTRPCQYLQHKGPFANAPDLLDVMSVHGAVLSGSRALDWFIPGSATATSDWDFYVPPLVSSIVAVKSALERSGVAFETCLEQAERQLREKTVIVLSIAQVISIGYEAYYHRRLWTTEQIIIIRAIYYTYPRLRNIWRYTRVDGTIRWIPGLRAVSIDRRGLVAETIFSPESELHHYYSNAAFVLTGHAKKFDQLVSVQLVVGCIDPRRIPITETMRNTVLPSIFGFYGSHVQCFLTKHMAFHMYYRTAAQKNAFLWQVPESIREKADAAVEKYTRRGYQFILPDPGLWTARSAADEEAFLIKLDNDKGKQPSLSQVRELEWEHSVDSIIPCVGRAEALGRHELLNFGVINRFCDLGL
jgi:hypothetical protein